MGKRRCFDGIYRIEDDGKRDSGCNLIIFNPVNPVKKTLLSSSFLSSACLRWFAISTGYCRHGS
jgi:hypothetical protein